MELINIRNHSLKYKTHQDIERALVWNAVKRFLEEQGKTELFSYISDVVITGLPKAHLYSYNNVSFF